MKEAKNTDPRNRSRPDGIACMTKLAVEVFGDEVKASQWINQKRKLFGGQSAMTLLQTKEGTQLVEDTLNQVDNGFAP